MDEEWTPIEKDHIFEFQVSQVWKVYDKGHLDYWVYGITLETDFPAILAGGKEEVANGHSSGTIHTGRRYRDFVWLQEAALTEFPGWIIPPLPGMAMEGMLEKVDALVLGSSEGQQPPALVSYRMFSLELFLRFLADIPPLRSSDIMLNFLHCSPEEMAQYQLQWHAHKHERRPPSPTPSRTTAVWLWLSRPFASSFRQADPMTEAAKEWALELEEALGSIKGRLEQMWDTLMLEREPYSRAQDRLSYKVPDPTLHAILNVSAEINRALSTFGRRNEELYMLLVVDVGFLHGLCGAIRSAVDHIESLERMECRMAEAGTTDQPAFAELNATLMAQIANFEHAFKLLPRQRRTAVQRLLAHYAELSSTMDPSLYPWRQGSPWETAGTLFFLAKTTGTSTPPPCIQLLIKNIGRLSVMFGIQ
eukprot:EG_transcript_12760